MNKLAKRKVLPFAEVATCANFVANYFGNGPQIMAIREPTLKQLEQMENFEMRYSNFQIWRWLDGERAQKREEKNKNKKLNEISCVIFIDHEIIVFRMKWKRNIRYFFCQHKVYKRKKVSKKKNITQTQITTATNVRKQCLLYFAR